VVPVPENAIVVAGALVVGVFLASAVVAVALLHRVFFYDCHDLKSPSYVIRLKLFHLFAFAIQHRSPE